jgi:hypothetical protein
MIGSWSNRIIGESYCDTWDRHTLDTSNPDVNYVALTLIPIDRVAADRPFYSGKHRATA